MSGVSGGFGSNPQINDLYNKIKSNGITKLEAQALVNSAIENGAIDDNERMILQEAAENITFDPKDLKKSNNDALNNTVQELFANGLKAKQAVKQNDDSLRASTKKDFTFTQKTREVTANTSNSAYGGLFDGVKTLRDKANNAINASANAIGSGLNYLEDKAGMDKKHHFGKADVRLDLPEVVKDVARSAKKGLENIANDAGFSKEQLGKINSSNQQVKQTKMTQGLKIGSEHEFDASKCISNALNTVKNNMNPKPDWKNIPQTPEVMSEGNLQKWTGQKWDGTNVRASQDLASVGKGQEGKALISDGGHVFVYQGFDAKSGKVNVTDPSGADPKKIISLSKNDPSLTLFTQGNGDANKTEAADPTRYSHKTEEMQPLKGVETKDSASFAARQATHMLAENSPKSGQLDGLIRNAAKTGNYNELNQFLNDNGMGALVKNGEVKSFVQDLTTPAKGLKASTKAELGGATTPLDAMKFLREKGSNSDKVNLKTGIEFSHIDLGNYFSTSHDFGSKSNNIMEDICNMKHKRGGC